MKNNLADKVAELHKPMDRALLRALSLLLAFGNVGLFMWEPNQYAEEIGGFSAFLGPLFIYSVCSSMVYGIGFKPRHWVWQIYFSPYLSIAALTYFTLVRFVV
ncbi:cyd operon protein YbgE [Vibrio penaeicida]|uniref:Cyd operon protein YbgE n=1 Tax=Vibrio penaeicida TaxID=104609 RepID=A0AAV5NLX3_9VIBR|nr:cyd operon protein YbgE [Vibrio penaeicida]MDP2570807.1 cyd operon protein YbgE [Vibrio penaeicida]RTZ23318.1 cyd operon protein YbgE [Vibrio penaeicida]GLQ71662.1 cyd operon protein YbgE [Vibrio penaeicida]